MKLMILSTMFLLASLALPAQLRYASDLLKVNKKEFDVTRLQLPKFAQKDFPPIVELFAPWQCPPSYTYDTFPFFCKNEVNIQRTSKIMAVFRLGMLDYVNRLEGKR